MIDEYYVGIASYYNSNQSGIYTTHNITDLLKVIRKSMNLLNSYSILYIVTRKTILSQYKYTKYIFSIDNEKLYFTKVPQQIFPCFLQCSFKRF